MEKTEGTQSLMKAAWLVAVLIVASKIMGFLRDVVIANFYGATVVSDAYFYAYQIPALAMILLGGVGGPFHSATVAVFTKLIDDEKLKANEFLNKLFNTFTTATFFVFLILAILVFIFSDEIMKIIILHGSDELIGLASLHLKIMSPVLILGGLVGIYFGLLISYKEFVLPNISPIVVSIVIITSITIAKHDTTGVVLAGATMLGALCQFLLQLPKIRKLGYTCKPNFNFLHNTEFKNLLELLFPAILSSTVGQIYVYVDMFFASQLTEGAWTAIGYSNRIFQFPVGILVTAFLVPLFPIFSKLVAQNNHEDIKYYFSKGVGMLNFVAFPILISILLLGHDAIRLVFERGAFTPNATAMVYQALFCLSFAIIPYVFRDSLTRVFYAFNDSKTPFIIAFCAIILKIILNSLFVDRFGISGITMSVTLVTLFNAVMLGILIKRKIDLRYNIYFKNLSKMILVSCLTSIPAFFGLKFLSSYLPDTIMFLFIKLVITGCLIFILYGLFSYLFKVEYLEILLQRIINRIKKYVR